MGRGGGAPLTTSRPARAGRRRAVRFAPEHTPAVQAFNRRLARAGAPWRFPETAIPDWLPQVAGVPVWQEYFLLLEDDTVRGAFVLKRQEAALGGGHRRVGSFYWPLSEGAIDSTYAAVAPRLLQAALEQEPLLFGIVARDQAIAKLDQALGWRLVTLPFYFKALRPTRFLRELHVLRRRPGIAFLLDVAALTGVGWLALKLAGSARGRRPRSDRTVRVELVERFGDWADAIWAANLPHYSFAGSRDAAALNATYPPGGDTFLRLQVSRGDRMIGWAVVQDSLPASNDHFGAMRVGTIVDGFAAPEHAGAVIRAGADVLAQRGMDLIISNQSHHAWRRGLVQAGFLPGPSSCLFAAAPALASLIAHADPAGRAVHVNRGDGDWPWGAGLEAPADPAAS